MSSNNKTVQRYWGEFGELLREMKLYNFRKGEEITTPRTTGPKKFQKFEIALTNPTFRSTEMILTDLFFLLEERQSLYWEKFEGKHRNQTMYEHIFTKISLQINPQFQEFNDDCWKLFLLFFPEAEYLQIIYM